MKKKKKKNNLVLIISVVIIIIAIIVVAIYLLNKPKENTIVEEFAITYEDGTKENTSKELAKEKKLDELLINNIILSYRESTDLTTLLADVTNTGNTKTAEQLIKVELLDKEENVIMELEQMLVPIEPGQSTQLNVNVSSDFAGAYNFRVSKE